MGRNKAFIEIDGAPLWMKQLQTLQSVAPLEIFIAGPTHPEWLEARQEIIPDAQDDTGPLGALVEGLRRCRAPLLFVLAVDLPAMTADYLRQLLSASSDGKGVVPTRDGRYEPLAAIYPKACLSLAENQLRAHRYSLQEFAAQCVAEGFLKEEGVLPHEASLFSNLNTPADLLAISSVVGSLA